MARFARCSLLALSLFALAASAAADTLEEAEKAVTAALGKHKTITFTSFTKSEMDMGGAKFTSESTSKIEALRTPSGFKLRADSKYKNVMGGEGANTMEGANLMIYDGEFMYMLNDMMGQKMATKDKATADLPNPFDGGSLFKSLKQEFELKLLPDEQVEGEACYAVECTPKGGSASQDSIARIVNFLSKKSGVSLKSVVYDKGGAAMTTTTTSELKLDSDLAPNRFEFKAPDGVTVMDSTANPAKP